MNSEKRAADEVAFQHNKLLQAQIQQQQQQQQQQQRHNQIHSQYMPKAVSPFASGHEVAFGSVQSSPVDGPVFHNVNAQQQTSYGRIGQMTPHQQVPYDGRMQQRSSPGAIGSNARFDVMQSQGGLTGGYHPAQLKQMNAMQTVQSMQGLPGMQQNGAEVPAGYGVPPQAMAQHGHGPGSKVAYQQGNEEDRKYSQQLTKMLKNYFA